MAAGTQAPSSGQAPSSRLQARPATPGAAMGPRDRRLQASPPGCQCLVLDGPASTPDSNCCPRPEAPRRRAYCRQSAPLLRHFSRAAVVASGLQPLPCAAGGTSAPVRAALQARLKACPAPQGAVCRHGAHPGASAPAVNLPPLRAGPPSAAARPVARPIASASPPALPHRRLNHQLVADFNNTWRQNGT
eukprot:253487-Chlamydomonas_euryale.AAC.1